MRSNYLFAECLFITFAVPVLLYLFADQRWVMLAALWGGAGLCAYAVTRQQSMKELWAGEPLSPATRRIVVMRYFICTVGLIALTLALIPDKFLGFPQQRPLLWLAVMTLYPLLSALPQEIIYRAFFFQRYAGVVHSRAVLITLSAVGFGLSHLMMENAVAPLLSIIGGFLFADSYARHKSLKWVTIEHALYGCTIFTVGLGWYFYFGNWH